MNRCIAGWPGDPCNVIGMGKICAYHQAVAEVATRHMTDGEVERLVSTLPTPLLPKDI